MKLFVLCLSYFFVLARCDEGPNDPDSDIYVPNKKMNDDFDWKLMQKVLQKSDKNIILSPLSVKIPLTLLAEAASRNNPSATAQELSQVLPEQGSLFDAKDYYQKVFDSLKVKSNFYSLDFASKIYLDKDIRINDRFATISENTYQTQSESLDFQDKTKSTRKINDWISEKTHGQIKDLIDEETVKNSVLLMLNAIYFKGTWRQSFMKNETVNDDFSVTPEKTVKTNFMRQKGKFFYGVSKNLNSKILRLPYKGQKFALFVILPNTVEGIGELVRKLEGKTLQQEVWHLNAEDVHVSIPKFKFDTTTHLNAALMELGIREIFTNEAQLNLLASSSSQLKVSNIVQKAGLSVDEEGSTAYAATTLQLEDKFGGAPVDFIANRPFIFYIEDETTGTKLFAGRVSNPTQF